MKQRGSGKDEKNGKRSEQRCEMQICGAAESVHYGTVEKRVRSLLQSDMLRAERRLRIQRLPGVRMLSWQPVPMRLRS